jgi:hypothetical protein
MQQRKTVYGVLAGDNPLFVPFADFLRSTHPEVVLSTGTELEPILRTSFRVVPTKVIPSFPNFVVVSGTVFDYDLFKFYEQFRELNSQLDSGEDLSGSKLSRRRVKELTQVKEELSLIDDEFKRAQTLNGYFDRARELGLFSPVDYSALIQRLREEFFPSIKICVFGNSHECNGKRVEYTRRCLTFMADDYVPLREGFNGLKERIDAYVRKR